MDESKPVHTVVLDTGAIIRNEPSVSTLIAKCENLVTVPEIISEIKDAATRSRVATTLQPFLTLRSPAPASVKFVTDFARRTGDLSVLSRPDIQIIALTYEIECERNQGDWRLRRVPGQRRVNGAPPAKANVEQVQAPAEELLQPSPDANAVSSRPDAEVEESVEQRAPDETLQAALNDVYAHTDEIGDLATPISNLNVNETSQDDKVDSAPNSGTSHDDSGSDSDGWITPSNLKKKQADDAGASTVAALEPKTMQAAVLTTDFAMQNVILQMNLNLLSPSLTRVKHLKTFVLRCHACFQVSKDMTKQFCPKCGQPTLTRVSCSTNANGEFKLHLKKNMQWNHRGDRYSIPKPVHGSSNGRTKGGGKGGWGIELILTEDQKEYERASNAEKKLKERSLMDEDYLPGILTGDRGRAGGRTKVGAGRNVNARKR